MRGWWVVGGGILLLTAAFGADRLLTVAVQNAGAYPGTNWTREVRLAAALVPRLPILAALAAIYGAVAIEPERRVALAIASIGFGFAIVPQVVFGLWLALRPSLEAQSMAISVASELSYGLFTKAAGTGLLVIALAKGLETSGWSRSRASVPPAWRLVIAVIAVLIAYPVDIALEATARDLSASLAGFLRLVLLDIAGRLGVMGALVLLLSMMLRGPRDRRVGAAVMTIGLLVFVGLPAFALATAPLLPSQPGGIGSAIDPGTMGRWLAGGLLLLGLGELAAPVSHRDVNSTAIGAAERDVSR